jgi:hypothetical protein
MRKILIDVLLYSILLKARDTDVCWLRIMMKNICGLSLGILNMKET